MKPFEEGSVVRRWAFYANHRLAYAGVARFTQCRVLQLRFIETEHHAHTATLPERIQFEQVIRRLVRSDVERLFGSGSLPELRFEPSRVEEQRLATQIFGAFSPKPISGQ